MRFVFISAQALNDQEVIDNCHDSLVDMFGEADADSDGLLSADDGSTGTLFTLSLFSSLLLSSLLLTAQILSIKDEIDAFRNIAACLCSGFMSELHDIYTSLSLFAVSYSLFSLLFSAIFNRTVYVCVYLHCRVEQLRAWDLPLWTRSHYRRQSNVGLQLSNLHLRG